MSVTMEKQLFVSLSCTVLLLFSFCTLLYAEAKGIDTVDRSQEKEVIHVEINTIPILNQDGEIYLTTPMIRHRIRLSVPPYGLIRSLTTDDTLLRKTRAEHN